MCSSSCWTCCDSFPSWEADSLRERELFFILLKLASHKIQCWFHSIAPVLRCQPAECSLNLLLCGLLALDFICILGSALSCPLLKSVGGIWWERKRLTVWGKDYLIKGKESKMKERLCRCEEIKQLFSTSLQWAMSSHILGSRCSVQIGVVGEDKHFDNEPPLPSPSPSPAFIAEYDTTQYEISLWSV